MPRSGWILVSAAGLAAIVLAAAGPLAFSQSEPPRKPAARPASDNERDDRARPAPAQRTPAAGVPRDTQEVALVMTPGREAAALKFAQLHHSQLEKLLVHLQNSNPAEYKRAIRQLYMDSERLARTAERSPERHELELDAWKLDSRIRLLVARMSMSSSGSVELDSQLKALLEQRVDLRLRQLQSERERLETRLSRLNETIENIEANPEEAALKDLQRVKRSLGVPRSPKTPPATRR
ncbi:MAG TPA: hypothetical protein VML55_19195 [Planctomycetaceae bacterium]|nr:hypothetical protein [Planctomycetaceae bacterium]